MNILNELRKCYHAYLKYKNRFWAIYYPGPYVYSIEETLKIIIEEKKSVCRFGDGELKWIAGIEQESFQRADRKMQIELINVLKKQNSALICLPDCWGDLDQFNDYAKKYYEISLGKYRKKWLQYIDVNRKYYNTSISRFYMDYKNKNKTQLYVDLLKKIWENRNVIIIEGKYTRFGVGNDLLDSAEGIKRILCPEIDAYESKEAIKNFVLENITKNQLILLALGPTATILAYELSEKGYQAIDIGHADIEYEWYRGGDTVKRPIKNKFVNEATNIGGREVGELLDQKYLSEIIKII